MSIVKQETHRPGPLKQTNKPHKTGRHRSKGSISLASKGKVSIKTLFRKKKKELSREERRHQSLQIRKNKRDEVLWQKRTCGTHAPFLVCIIPLHKKIDPEQVLSLLKECDPEANIVKSDAGVVHISIPRFKQKFSFVIPALDNEFEILDIIKVCNSALFVLSASHLPSQTDDSIDEWGANILNMIRGQGLPTPIVTLMDLSSINPKKRNDIKQSIQKNVSKVFPEEKVMHLETSSDGLNLLRRIGNQKQKKVTYRDRRPHLLAETYEFSENENDTKGTVKISGYLRGKTLNVNDLIHIVGLGDFQMSKIEFGSDPLAIEKSKRKSEELMDTEFRSVFESKPEERESLVSENIPDPLDAEQTWPTEEELKIAEDEQKSAKKIKKVPKGWSDYQACWIPDVDAEVVSDDNESDGDDEMEYEDACSDEGSSSDQEDDDFKTVITESEVAVNDEKYDQDIDFCEEARELEKIKEAKSDFMFPDEIDTPLETPARERFQKYRGLESFRTSAWDPKENLPYDYARIFQFQNFERTKKRTMKQLEDKDGVEPGTFVTIHACDVPTATWTAFLSTRPKIVVFGMHPHEHKMSVVNVVLNRPAGGYPLPIRSKEQLVFQCGYRRFSVAPIFSQHTNSNKHKYERFFRPESTVVATFFAPIQFPPAPVLCFKPVMGQLTLVASGGLMSCDPDRLVIKRVVLSGHPFKVHKKSAVIRFMFFNREDILYFKPCKLRTKMGRVGHIKEPLGTHGHMKCIFDGQLKSQDTVLLNLYKRVYPKWSYEPLLIRVIES